MMRENTLREKEINNLQYSAYAVWVLVFSYLFLACVTHFVPESVYAVIGFLYMFILVGLGVFKLINAFYIFPVAKKIGRAPWVWGVGTLLIPLGDFILPLMILNQAKKVYKNMQPKKVH